MNRSPEPLGVCLVVAYFTIGGLERVVVDLANGLAQRGVPVRVVVLETGKRNALITELGEAVEVCCLRGNLAERLLALRRLTKGWLVHLHFGDGKLRVGCRAVLADRPWLVLTYHSVYRHLRRWYQNMAERRIHRQFDAIVAVSDAVRSYCVEEVGLDPERIRVIVNGIDARPVSSIASDAKALRLASVGSLYPHKHQRVLIDALGLVAAEQTVHLALVGDGPCMAALDEQARQKGVHHLVTWHGALWRREAVAEVLAAADVFVTASTFEGFSIALLEAMAMGLAIVASDIEPHALALDDAGLRFPAGDAPALAAHILELARRPKLRSRLGRDARARAAVFGLDAFVDHHLDLYGVVAPSFRFALEHRV